jgi:Leucine-rich repeat (LRR) protein
LTDNQISDLGPLTNQTQITKLILPKNKVASLTPLVKWLKADAEGAKRFAPYLELYLVDNPLDEESRTKHIPALKGFGVRFKDFDKK